MAEPGGRSGQAALAGQRCRCRADEAPEHPQQHDQQQQDADTLVQVRCGPVPAAVVVQPDHPETQGEQTEYRHGHQPMQHNAGQPVMRRGITPVHRIHPSISRVRSLAGYLSE